LSRRNDSIREIAYKPGPGAVDRAGRGRRSTRRVEASFQTSKGLTGLDQHHVRRWSSWDRWTTLPMLVHAFLLPY
jgi:hypothetical protein